MSATRKALGIVALAAALAPVAHAEVVAITGGTVHTMGPAGTIEGGTVLLEDGRIREVGRDVAIPAGARRVDATGKVVTPGLFDSLSRLGLVEVSAVEGTADAEVEDERLTVAFDVARAVDPRSTLIEVNRVEGLTRAVVAPEPGRSLIAGRGAIIHLGGPQEYLVRSPVAVFAVLGERGAAIAGGSRAAALARLEEALQDALDYLKNREAWERAERRPYALSRLDLEALAPVVRGELPLVVNAHKASDIEAALGLAKDYRLKLVLAGVAEGWMVAAAIAAAGVPVLVKPITNLPDRFETLGSTLENAARLRKAGVTVAFMSNDAHNARNLKQGAGNAVAYGLPWEEALAALTIVPARVWGLADRLGSLERGKEADVVVWDGDPLEVTTFADVVFIRGVEMPMETRHTKLRDRYRKLDGDLPPAYRE